MTNEDPRFPLLCCDCGRTDGQHAGLDCGPSLPDFNSADIERGGIAACMRLNAKQRDEIDLLRARLMRIHLNVQKHPQWSLYTELLDVWADSKLEDADVRHE